MMQQISTGKVWVFISVLLLFSRLAQGRNYNVTHSSQSTSADNDTEKPPTISIDFLEACTKGDMNEVKRRLHENPVWVNGRSPQGESCLHVAGILGQPGVTKMILNRGGDPNIRSAFERGLRMHPLSWNVYGGHLENTRMLLQHGAIVNLDVDSMKDDSRKVTAMDILEEVIGRFENATQEEGRFIRASRKERYYKLKALLLEYGAQRYDDLSVNPEYELRF